MNWNAKRPRIERAAEWGAICSVGAAVAFALSRLTPFGPLAAAGAALGAAAAAWLVLAFVEQGEHAAAPAFAVVDFPPAESDVVLLLEARPGDDDLHDALLLDDPLPREESRVVRLFGPAAETAAPPAAVPAALAPPGEMLARIEDFLGAGRAGTGGGGPAEPATPGRRESAEASAALHAALADIRASLRR
jgi:hypothetical protein